VPGTVRSVRPLGRIEALAEIITASALPTPMPLEPRS
jgi:hypothetical protein